eukprot:TRINITY_DN19484_c0_g1_i1.p1 TRINITY_DN19484_c0_g1~~TRINITY_DN19484_c0_g1_i1.p1  ORF type:complete len:412 (+),score=61.61 TRINITY_DN19484_c0_g1_i1:69-1238(+)
MSLFTVLVCADVYGSKVNLEVPFPNVPTISELTHTIEKVFEQEAAFLKPPGYPPTEIKVSRIQIYDDTYLKWMDLVNSSQVHEYDQLYVFQPQSPWHVDLQKDLPAPRPPTASMPQGHNYINHAVQNPVSPYNPPPAQVVHQHHAGFNQNTAPPTFASPQHQATSKPSYLQDQPTGAAAAARERPNVPKDVKVQNTFREIDTQQKGWIDVADFERGFRSRGIDFSSATVQELFSKGDTNRDGRLDWAEWGIWTDLYPNTLEVMYYRGRETLDDEQLTRERNQTQEAIDRNRQREADLRRQIDEVNHEYTQLTHQLSEHDTRSRESANRRNLLEQQERDLLEQEIKLERQKDQLRASQYRFQEVAQTFDGSAVGQGSPRRAKQDQVHQFR